MHHLNAWPCLGQAFGDEAAVAPFGSRLAAEQTADGLLERGPVEGVRDSTLVHQRLELQNVVVPVAVFTIGVPDLSIRGELREVDVTRAVETAQKPGQVILLGKTRELPTGV